MEKVLESLNTAFSSAYKELKAEEVFKKLQSDGNTEEMVKYALENVKILTQDFLKLPLSNQCKDDRISIKLREEGNELYKRKRLREALERYNKCISLAPHPKVPCVTDDTNDYTSLAMGYINRSAVLIQLKEYSICLLDIDRSLQFCNSKITRFKLQERKVKCLIALGRFEEARSLLKMCTMMLQSLELEDKPKEFYEQSLSNLLLSINQMKPKHKKQCKKQKSKYEEIKSACKKHKSKYEEITSSSSFSSDDLIFAYNNPSPPHLDDEPNPTIPAFSCALKLQYAHDQGRFVVAARDIKPGEVLAVETAFTSYVHPADPSSASSICTFCLSRCAAPVPCHECTNVVFCNEECRSNGWKKFHMKECPVYLHLQILDDSCINAYRVIAGKSLDELKAIVPKLKKDELRSPLERMLDEDQICDSNSYRSLYFLEGIIEHMETELLFIISVQACIMIQLLIRSNRYFNSSGGNQIVPDLETIIFIGSLFVRHACGINCNSYGIYETHIIPNKLNSSENVQVGTGTYIAESLFNHSCCPSAKIFFYGNVGVCRAIRFISSGDEVSVSYSPLYYTEPNRNARRNYLSSSYSFDCKCEACISDFDVECLDLEEFLHKCPVSKLKNKPRTDSKNDPHSIKCLQKELNVLQKKNHYELSKLTSSGFDVTNYLELAQGTIEFFDKFVEMPDHLYIQLSGIFREIFDQRGSCYFIEDYD